MYDFFQNIGDNIVSFFSVLLSDNQFLSFVLLIPQQGTKGLFLS